MKTSTAFALFIVGLVVTMLGVGGVEASMDNLQLLQALAVSCVGLAVMYCGTLAMNVSNYYDAE